MTTASYSNGTWSVHSKYEEMPEQFTEEEWNKFCEEMGLEDGYCYASNNNGTIINGGVGVSTPQYTLSVTPGTNSYNTTAAWTPTANYNGFSGYCTSEPAGKYYTITPGVKVRVSQWGHKVIWVSECKFLINLDNKGNYSVNVIVDEWNNLEFNTIDEARRHLLRLTKTYKEIVAFTKKLDINTMFEDSNESKV